MIADTADMTVKNCMLDAILTSIDKLKVPPDDKKPQNTFHPTTHCQCLKIHRRDKTQSQAALSLDLPMHLNRDPKDCQDYSSQQQRGH